MGKNKQKAIFLDRDGTIVYHTKRRHVLRPRQLRLLPGVAKAISLMNELGFLVIVVTNQPTVSYGVITLKGMERLHDNLTKRLKRKGAHVHGVYFCPHHPASKIPQWGIVCKCRKPEPGMILEALKDHNIDPKKSFMIGDALIDVVAGKRAGVKAIQVKTGPGHTRLDKLYHRTKPDFVVKNLTEAARIIKNKSRERYVHGKKR